MATLKHPDRCGDAAGGAREISYTTARNSNHPTNTTYPAIRIHRLWTATAVLTWLTCTCQRPCAFHTSPLHVRACPPRPTTPHSTQAYHWASTRAPTPTQIWQIIYNKIVLLKQKHTKTTRQTTLRAKLHIWELSRRRLNTMDHHGSPLS